MRSLKQLTTLLVVALLLPIGVFAQKITKEQEAQVRAIKNNEDLLYGEGTGTTDDEANDYALKNLIEKIAVSVSSSVDLQTVETRHDSESHYDKKLQSLVSTYSFARLTNARSLVLGFAPRAHVIRYISKSDLDSIFNDRKEKMYDMLRSAAKCEQERKIGDALRYYYWGYCLLKTLRYPDRLDFKDENGTKHLLSVYLPQKMESVFQHLKMVVTEREGNEMETYVTYKGEPVVNDLYYRYYDGVQYIDTKAKDGRGHVTLYPGFDSKELRVKYEYVYEGKSHLDKEVESIIKIFKDTSFPDASVAVSTKAQKLSKDTQKAITEGSIGMSKEFAETVAVEEKSREKQYEQVMEQIVKAINEQQHSQVQSCFTKEGWDMYDKLLHYGKAKIMGKVAYTFCQMGEKVVCRSIPMRFDFPNNQRSFVEDVTFTFNKEGKIEALAFALGKEAKTDIFDRAPGLWSNESKMILATFLENYKTAFALKRLSYIERLFDDNAVIIIGHMVKEKAWSNEAEKYVNNEHVKYNRVSKQEYIQRLRSCFGSNEYINIQFTHNDISKMGKGGELYGIQIRQDYYSTNYGDTGFLFLLVDVNNPEEPVIFVRTWQPERDPNINGRLPKDDPDFGIYSGGYF